MKKKAPRPTGSMVEVSEKQDLILGMASHELKNNLTSLQAYTQLLKKHADTVADKKTASYLSKIEGKIFSLNALIHDMLDMTKIRTNNLVIKKHPCDLDVFIEEIVEDMQQLTKKHIISKKGTLQKLVVIDTTRIEQVLSNLIRNAIKYSPQSKIIDIYIYNNKKEVIIQVQDFGIGIAPERQKDIFQPFNRITDPSRPKYPGFGLGLYICAEIIQLHGGRMWVESEEGKGSTFSFSLPVTN